MRDRTVRLEVKTNRTLTQSSEYFLGLAIAGASPSARTEPGIGASNFPRVLQRDARTVSGLNVHVIAIPSDNATEALQRLKGNPTSSTRNLTRC